MRRSKAPSMINKSKRLCQESVSDSNGSEPDDDTSYKWGSKDNPEAAEKEYLSKNKRIFTIVWRDVTTKKHKTWKGDGTLELNLHSMKAVVKDETGKYLGTSTKFRVKDLQEDFQMLIGGKEIEIQNEIKDEEEIYELRKRQARNRNWGEGEYVTPEMKAEEEKKPKGGFRFKPLLVLKPPENNKTNESKNNFEEEETPDNLYNKRNQVNLPCGSKDLEYHTARSTNILKQSEDKVTLNATIFTELNSKHIPNSSQQCNYKSKSLICFVKPSELQHYLFQQIRDYYTTNSTADLNSHDLLGVLRQICHHPSFIKHSTSNNVLVQHLTPSLPHWSEMGPFDSAKLEFIQYFIQNSIEKSKQSVIIIADSKNVFNMIQGLCDFMHITCFRLNSHDSEETKSKILEEYSNKYEENTTPQVVLTNTIRNFKDTAVSLNQQQIIAFENISENMKEIHDFELLDRTTVYYLVTAFSIEEIFILPSYQNNANQINYDELLNLFDTEDPFCYVHTKIKCNCDMFKNNTGNSEDLEFFKRWRHLGCPVDEHFLKESALDNSSGNLISIFYKVDL